MHQFYCRAQRWSEPRREAAAVAVAVGGWGSGETQMKRELNAYVCGGIKWETCWQEKPKRNKKSNRWGDGELKAKYRGQKREQKG